MCKAVQSTCGNCQQTPAQECIWELQGEQRFVTDRLTCAVVVEEKDERVNLDGILHCTVKQPLEIWEKQ